MLANAAHVKNVPGRKTDVKDAVWLSDLMAPGLIRGSFVPDTPTQEMRDLLRTRKQFVRERSSHVQRIQKALDAAKITLDSVVSDVVGLSGRRMIEVLIRGETEPRMLAALADRRLHASPSDLEAALRGRERPTIIPSTTAFGSLRCAGYGYRPYRCSNREQPRTFRKAVELLITIPGVSRCSAEVIVSEVGLDMGRFAKDG